MHFCLSSNGWRRRWRALECAPISPNLPLSDDSFHIRRTRKWPPSPSFLPVPTRSRSDERVVTRTRRSFAATTPIAGPARLRPGSNRGWRRTRRPSPASRPLGSHRPSYSRYLRRRETAAAQQVSNAHDAQARSREGEDRPSAAAAASARAAAERAGRTDRGTRASSTQAAPGPPRC